MGGTIRGHQRSSEAIRGRDPLTPISEKVVGQRTRAVERQVVRRLMQPSGQQETIARFRRRATALRQRLVSVLKWVVRPVGVRGQVVVLREDLLPRAYRWWFRPLEPRQQLLRLGRPPDVGCTQSSRTQSQSIAISSPSQRAYILLSVSFL